MVWPLGLIAACRPAPTDTPSPEAPPLALVEIPAGRFTLGRDGSPHRDEGPAHLVSISAFALQPALVTVADFRRFVEETGYVTSAERLGFGMVSVEGMDDWAWREVRGASWRAPWGPDSGVAQADDHPVVSVSWLDADAYCRHYGLRLPTEAEWVYAMSAGTGTHRFPWGDDPHLPDGRYGLNFWQGLDHHHNTMEDGHRYTSPVGSFPPNAWGISDPVGNVWQWTADWYAADTYARNAEQVPAVDPKGPADGWARVARGGSWWCSRTSCSAYGLFARGKSRPSAPYPNNGFRCAR